jgi:hypothetical protein
MGFLVFQQDPITVGMCYGLNDGGVPRPVTQILLRELIDAWHMHDSVPDGVQSLLRAAQGAMVASLTTYQLLPYGVLASLQAVEAALRERLLAHGESDLNRHGSPLSWGSLWERAVARGIVTPEPDEDGMDIIDVGRRIRNMYAHPRAALVMTYAMALPLIGSSHDIVSRLYTSDR